MDAWYLIKYVYIRSIDINIRTLSFSPLVTTSLKTAKKIQSRWQLSGYYWRHTLIEISIGVIKLHYGYTKPYNPHPLHFALLYSPADPPAPTRNVSSVQSGSPMPLLSVKLLSFTIHTASHAFCPLLSLPLAVLVKFAPILHCCCSIAHLPPTCSVHTPHQLSSSSPWGVNRCWACAGWSGGTWQHMLLLQLLLNPNLLTVLLLFFFF